MESSVYTGTSTYHLTWKESTVRAYLADRVQKVRVPVIAPFGHPAANAVRYVEMQAVAEVIIHNWPSEDAPEC